jgi:hypothetical protein
MFIKKTICDVIHRSRARRVGNEENGKRDTHESTEWGETILKRSVSCNKDDNWQMGSISGVSKALSDEDASISQEILEKFCNNKREFFLLFIRKIFFCYFSGEISLLVAGSCENKKIFNRFYQEISSHHEEKKEMQISSLSLGK